MDVGRLRLYRMEGAMDGTLQVASAWGPDGQVSVLLRAGAMVLDLTPDGAESLGRSLVEEAQVARRQEEGLAHG